MVIFYLNTFLVVADACEGVNQKWEACSSKNNTQAPVHPHIKLSKSRTRIKPTWWKWLDEIPVCPQECFAYYKRPFWHVLCYKRIGLPRCNFVTITIICSLQIALLSNYRLPTISVPAENTLLKIACHFLLLLVWSDTLTYQKDYDWAPILVGHQDSFLAPFAGSEASLVSGIW